MVKRIHSNGESTSDDKRHKPATQRDNDTKSEEDGKPKIFQHVQHTVI